jgi:fatty acid-binding protein DegV
MTVRIVTDSTAHLDPDLVAELGICVVPFHVQIGGQNYLDGIDLDDESFRELVYERELIPETQPPTVDEFAHVYEELDTRDPAADGRRVCPCIRRSEP